MCFKMSFKVSRIYMGAGAGRTTVGMPITMRLFLVWTMKVQWTKITKVDRWQKGKGEHKEVVQVTRTVIVYVYPGCVVEESTVVLFHSSYAISGMWNGPWEKNTWCKTTTWAQISEEEWKRVTALVTWLWYGRWWGECGWVCAACLQLCSVLSSIANCYVLWEFPLQDCLTVLWLHSFGVCDVVMLECKPEKLLAAHEAVKTPYVALPESRGTKDFSM